MTRSNQFEKCWIMVMSLAGIGLGSCKTAETESACTWVYSPDECKSEEGDDEVGDDVDDGDEPNAGPACITQEDGTTRTVHQCHGALSGRIAFTALGKSCPEALGSEEDCMEIHDFGTEPYELTKVMACCDPYEDDSDLEEYQTFCAADLAQQICSSVSTRIKKLIDDGDIPKVAESVAIQKWIATNQDKCFEAFWAGNMADEPGALAGTWTVPNKPEWQALIQGFTVTIDAASIDDVSLPADPANYVDCTDNSHNNTEIFESQASSPGITYELTLASGSRASLSGPQVMGGHVSGAQIFASQASDCMAPWCSTASFAVDATEGSWTLDDMNLFVDGDAMLGNGSASLAIDRASIRLYETSSGVIFTDRSGAEIHELRPGAVHFVAAGASSTGIGLYLLSNASPITAHESESGWVFDGFILEHVDVDGNTWTLTLPPMTWN